MPISSLLHTRLALPFRDVNYGSYIAGNGISLIGTWMQRISIGWLTWQLTQSGLWLGIMAFADFFPVFVIGPLAGAAADRWDRLRVVKTTQVVSLLQATVLVLLVASDRMTIGVLVALTAFQGCVDAFNQPARLALVPSLVAPADLASAVAINSVVFNLARFIGPMLAGMVIVWWGVAPAFAANALSYLAFLVALTRVKVDAVPEDSHRPRSLAGDLMEGIHYTATHPAIAALLLLMTAIGFGGRPLNELLPGLAEQVFHSGAAGLSVLASATGAGAIMGGLWLGHRADASSLTPVVIGTSLGSAVAAIAVIATDSLWLAVLAIAAFGFCLSASGIAIQTHVQVTAARRMRGRVMGLYALIFRGAPAIGALAAGLGTIHLGLRWPIVIGSLIVSTACGWIYLKRGQIRSSLAASDPAGDV